MKVSLFVSCLVDAWMPVPLEYSIGSLTRASASRLSRLAALIKAGNGLSSPEYRRQDFKDAATAAIDNRPRRLRRPVHVRIAPSRTRYHRLSPPVSTRPATPRSDASRL